MKNQNMFKRFRLFMAHHTGTHICNCRYALGPTAIELVQPLYPHAKFRAVSPTWSAVCPIIFLYFLGGKSSVFFFSIMSCHHNTHTHTLIFVYIYICLQVSPP